MPHEKVFAKFKLYFPQYADIAEMWFQNGKDSVRIKLKNKCEVVFTFKDEYDWKLETVKSFVSGIMKGDN